MEVSILSLIPPILALMMVMLTRKVLPSLGVGIVVGALMINFESGTNNFSSLSNNFIIDSISQIALIMKGIFIDDGAINTWELYIIFFLLLLGMIASLIAVTGGSQAFGEWAMRRVKTRVGAQLVTVLLGVIIFIDDYFNSLTVGNVGRPLTDRHRVSRAKLAYLVDSTAAPMCVIAPVSSWGAYIITIIGGILMTHSVTQWEALHAFVLIAPMNFYAIFAIFMVIAVVYFKIDIGQMRIHEQRAIETGKVVDKEKGPVPGEQGDVSANVTGKVGNLIWPIVTLIIATVFFMVTTGIQGSDGDTSILAIFENTDVAAALVYGGLVSLAVTLVLSFSRKLGVNQVGGGLWAGVKSMMPAIFILIFAWTIISIISDLGTGEYLASIVDEHMNVALLPAVLFIIAGFMAFSTGTSWGTFGIMLPIAGDIAAATDVSLMLPVLAAVLAGSIFGDHCSPISDTTILSSTGAGSHHIDHVLTQLPYALIIAGISIVGYLALGFTRSAFVGFLAAAVTFVVVVILMKRLFPALKGA